MKTITGLALIMAGVLLLPGVTNLPAQSANGARPANCDQARKLYDSNLAKHRNSADMLVLPGLLADRKAKRIEVMAEYTGLKTNETAEFLLIDQNCGHAYEALFRSFAQPSDVHKALMFIGIQPGNPFNPAQIRLRPKGELINVSVLKNNGSGNSTALRIENLILDKKTSKPLPESGFIFSGSTMLPAPNSQTGVCYAADFYEPKSIISIYNALTTVLDVPRQANQDEVYNFQVVNPAHKFAEGELITIVMEPDRKDGVSRIKNLVMEFQTLSRPAGTNMPFNILLKDSGGKTLVKSQTMENVVSVTSELKKNGFDSYLSVHFDNTLKLQDVCKACFVVSILELKFGLSIEPPAKGQLYYKAFLPDNRWRNREDRPAQPWELRVVKNNDKVSGILFQNEAIWSDDNNLTPTIKTASFDVSTPEALQKKLDDDAKQRKLADKPSALPVLLIFAETNLFYGELMFFIETALPTYNTIHVFLPAEK